MFTQEVYQRTIKFAGEAHKNQKVPGAGANYLVHLSNVAMEVMIAYYHSPYFDVGFAMQLAFLHDSIEDTQVSYKQLKRKFGEKVAKAVDALTKNNKIPQNERMAECLDRIKEQPNEVGITKLADRITNLQRPPKNWNKEKILSYKNEATLILENLNDKNNYLVRRLAMKIKEYDAFI